MKISNDTIGNRTRDLPACSAVPQTTVPPCTPDVIAVTMLTAGFWWVLSCSVVIMQYVANPTADAYRMVHEMSYH